MFTNVQREAFGGCFFHRRAAKVRSVTSSPPRKQSPGFRAMVIPRLCGASKLDAARRVFLLCSGRCRGNLARLLIGGNSTTAKPDSDIQGKLKARPDVLRSVRRALAVIANSRAFLTASQCDFSCHPSSKSPYRISLPNSRCPSLDTATSSTFPKLDQVSNTNMQPACASNFTGECQTSHFRLPTDMRLVLSQWSWMTSKQLVLKHLGWLQMSSSLSLKPFGRKAAFT